MAREDGQKKPFIIVSIDDLDCYNCYEFVKSREDEMHCDFALHKRNYRLAALQKCFVENWSDLVAKCGKNNTEDSQLAFQGRLFILVGDIDQRFVTTLENNGARIDSISARDNISRLQRLYKRLDSLCSNKVAKPSDEEIHQAMVSHVDYPAWKDMCGGTAADYLEYRKKDSLIRNEGNLSLEDPFPELNCVNCKLENAMNSLEGKEPVSVTANRRENCKTYGPVLELIEVPVGHLYSAMDAIELKDSSVLSKLPKGQFSRATLIGGTNEKQIHRLAFYASSQIVDEISALATSLGFRVKPDESRKFARHRGITMQLDTLCTPIIHTDKFSELADSIIDNVLAGNRPAERIRTHFFATFDVGDSFSIRPEHTTPITSDIQTLSNSTNDEKSYFLPELRARLFGDDGPDATNSPLLTRSFRITLDEEATLSVEHGNYGGELAFNLVEANIHTAGNVALLEWVVEADVEKNEEEIRSRILDFERTNPCEKPEPHESLSDRASSLWQQLLEKKQSKISFAQAIDFNAEARFTYFTYRRLSVSQDGTPVESKVHLKSPDNTHTICLCQPDAPEAEKKPILHALLERVYGGAAESVLQAQLSDDRARVLTSIVLFGNPPETGTGMENERILLSQVNQVDPYSTGYAYSTAQADKELAQSTYARFPGSHLMMTEHSFSYVGYRGGNRPPSRQVGQKGAPPAELSYAEKYIHPDHMRGTYRRMFMHFLFLEAELRSISKTLASLENRIGRRRGVINRAMRNRISDLRHWMTLAGSNLRQRTLSTQIQGREITEKLAARFRLEPEWQALDAKINALENLIEEDAARTTAHQMQGLYLLGIVFTVFTFLLSTRPATLDTSGGLVGKLRQMVFGAEPTSSSGFLDWFYSPVIFIQDILNRVFSWDSESAALILWAGILAFLIWWISLGISRYRRNLDPKSF